MVKLTVQYFNSSSRVACIVPIYNSREQLARLLDSISNQTVSFDLFVVDSGSTDGTLELARERIGKVVTISSAEFNHGGTRQFMVDTNHGYDVYIFLTQDAYLANSNAIARIIAPFADPQVGAVCGRQLPHLNARPLAQHARIFNYPKSFQIKSIADTPILGLKTAFISNSFAAYRASTLQQIGGFPKHVIGSEDLYIGAKALLAGWKLVYAGDAECYHSHNYTILEEFRRYFDIGVFHARESWIREKFGGVRGEGIKYVRSEIAFLGLSQVYLWPGALLRNALKLLAYTLGHNERHLPIWLKRNISMHWRYWEGSYAEVDS